MNAITENAPVSLTPNAVKEIRRLMTEDGFDSRQLLRIGVKGGGCSGMSYILGFDEKKEDDVEYQADGFSFVMNPSHAIYLMGMEVDWQDGLNARGFTFSNPNATKSCGCGSSFAV